MYRCHICRFEIDLDDVAVGGAPGFCICLLCYGRSTGTARRMPKALQRALVAALAELEPA